jgi:hypothetical protein
MNTTQNKFKRQGEEEGRRRRIKNGRGRMRKRKRDKRKRTRWKRSCIKLDKSPKSIHYFSFLFNLLQIFTCETIPM